MTTDEIMKKIREGLTGEYSVDMVYLESQADKYRSAKNAKEIGSAIADLAYEILPDDKREVLNKMMYIDGKRLDVVFAEANKLIQEKKIEESFKLTEALYTKIRMNYRETESEVYLSFRNTLEHQLYLYFYRPSKKLVRPVFDLSQMILLHGYNLLELNRAEEAARVINDAIRYNPMNTDAYFELAECYKSLRDHDQLLSVIKETLEVAVTPVQISRCYCDLGFYCVEVKDYDRAVCFYYESLIYADHPMVPAELHLHRRDSLRGAMVLQEELKSLPSVEILYDHVVTEICGEDMVEKLRIKNVKTEEEKDLEAAGIFIAVGIHPNTELLQSLVTVGEDGYIPAGETGETDIPGIYVAGDIRKKPLRQVVTAVADGANAAVSAGNYCNRFRKQS